MYFVYYYKTFGRAVAKRDETYRSISTEQKCSFPALTFNNIIIYYRPLDVHASRGLLIASVDRIKINPYTMFIARVK